MISVNSSCFGGEECYDAGVPMVPNVPGAVMLCSGLGLSHCDKQVVPCFTYIGLTLHVCAFDVMNHWTASR